MNPDLSELVSNFLLLSQNFKQFFAKNQPTLWKLMENQENMFQKDPFGRYFNCILHVGANPQCSMTEFADQFNLNPATATGVINKLVEVECIERVANPKDRRKVELILAQRGKIIYSTAKDFERNQIQDLLGDFSPEEIQFILKIMKKLNDNPKFQRSQKIK